MNRNIINTAKNLIYKNYKNSLTFNFHSLNKFNYNPLKLQTNFSNIINYHSKYQFSNQNNKDNKQPQKQTQKGQKQQKQEKKQENLKQNQTNQKKQSNFNQYKPQQQQNTNSNHNQNNNNNNKDSKKYFQQLLKQITLFSKKVIHKKHSVYSLAAIALIIGFAYSTYDRQTQLTPTQFMNMLQTNAFKQIQFIQQQYYMTSQAKVKKVLGKINDQAFFTYVLSFDQFIKVVINNPQIKSKNILKTGVDAYLGSIYRFFDIISIIAIIFILRSSIKKGQGQFKNMLSGGNKNKRFTVTKNTNVKFADVAGMQESKREVLQIVDFLKNPTKYHMLGATIPKGVLMTGPPGTGKTLLAKACAGQAQVPFYSVSGSDFVQMYVGVGASRVRQLFHEAKLNAPSIIFIDELDAIGKKRSRKMGSNDQRQSTLNQLLVQMDGFSTSNSVIIMGATNRKQILDQALIRPGRFDRQVQINLPDLKGRYQIFKVHLKPIILSEKYSMDQYAKRLACLTPGFSGAQISNLCNQAAILAARYNKGIVQMIDFQLSSQRVIGGVQRKGFVSMSQRKTVAYHQCGHAVVAWFLQGADPLLKVTIIPRSKGALGFAQYFVNQNQLQTKQQLMDRICFILGGRCAELYFFNEVTTGAYDDLQKAYDLAYKIVAKFGMSQKLGYIAFPDVRYTKPYSEQVQAQLDRQIQQIIKECAEKTKQMVKLHQKHIQNLAQQLLKKQTLDARSIQKILGQRPFAPNKTFAAYLDMAQQDKKQQLQDKSQKQPAI